MTKLPKSLIIIFVAFFLLEIAGVFFYLLNPDVVEAVEFDPQVSIPGSEFQVQEGEDKGIPVSGSTETIGKYIRAIYQYGIGAVGIVAALALMVGGLIRLAAGGSAEKVSLSSDIIKGALTGLVIALMSYLILMTINPDLVAFRPLVISQVKEVPVTYGYTDSKAKGWNDFISSGKVISQAGRYIAQNEGIRLEKYEDSLGNETIGIGHKLELNYPRDKRIFDRGYISEDEAYDLFKEDYEEAVAIMRSVYNEKTGRSYTTLSSDPRGVVLIDMAYNLGEGGSEKGLRSFTEMWNKIKAEEWGKAADEILKSKYAEQVADRAERNAQIMRSGEMPK